MSSMYLPYDLLNDINMASTFSASNSIKSFNTNHNMYINTCNDNSYAKTMNTSQLMSQQDCSELIFPTGYIRSEADLRRGSDDKFRKLPCNDNNSYPNNMICQLVSQQQDCNDIIFPAGYARSAAELRRGSEDKFRQLPCRTFISVGICPYRERCVYLHDPRLSSRDARSKTRSKNREDIVIDSLFWPVMSSYDVSQLVDSKGQRAVSQQYHVPVPRCDEYQKHDEAVYSMWNNFVDTCAYLNGQADYIANSSFYDCENRYNCYISKSRLPVFLMLSAGYSVSDTSYACVTSISAATANANPNTSNSNSNSSSIDDDYSVNSKQLYSISNDDFNTLTVNDGSMDKKKPLNPNAFEFHSLNSSPVTISPSTPPPGFSSVTSVNATSDYDASSHKESQQQQQQKACISSTYVTPTRAISHDCSASVASPDSVATFISPVNRVATSAAVSSIEKTRDDNARKSQLLMQIRKLEEEMRLLCE